MCDLSGGRDVRGGFGDREDFQHDNGKCHRVSMADVEIIDHSTRGGRLIIELVTFIDVLTISVRKRLTLYFYS